MEHLLDNFVFFQDKIFLRGYTFGVIHAGLIVIGYYTGWSINRLLKIASNGYIAGIFGAIFAHVIADLVASLIDPDIRPATLGIFLGGLTPLMLIPIFEKFITKSKHHIVVGDHEDIQKDLKDDHNH
jgi:H+/Cl- antiporter ClcA